MPEFCGFLHGMYNEDSRKAKLWRPEDCSGGFFFEGENAETSYDKKPSPEEKQSKIPRIRAIWDQLNPPSNKKGLRPPRQLNMYSNPDQSEFKV